MRVLFCSDVESAPFWIFPAAVHFSTYTLREALQKEEHKPKGCIAPFGVRLRSRIVAPNVALNRQETCRWANKRIW